MNMLCEKLIRTEIIVTEGREKTFEYKEVGLVDGSRNWDFTLFDA